MAKFESYELLIDGEMLGPLLALWIARLTRLELWIRKSDRTSSSDEMLHTVWKAANQAHTDLTSLHIYQKRNPPSSPKVHRQLQIASDRHQEADKVYKQLLTDRAD